MKPFVRFTAIAAPLDESNVDTDRIIPGRFLRKPRSEGYGDYLFHDVRFRHDGSEIASFPLNQPGFRQAKILVTDDNFGCGSSREGAIWALVDSGFRALIAPSFADIFYSNACKNGLLPVRLPPNTVSDLRAQLHRQPGIQISVDLVAETVTVANDAVHHFEIDRFRKECLLKGLDDIDLTWALKAEIAAFAERRKQHVPWIFSTSSVSPQS